MKYFIYTNSDHEEFTYIYIQSEKFGHPEKDTDKHLHIYNELQFCNETVYRYDVVEISEEQYKMLHSLNSSGNENYYDEAVNVIDSELEKY